MGVDVLHKPRIVLLIDKPNWVFRSYARSFTKELSQYFIFKTISASDKPTLDLSNVDILHVLGGEQLYHLHSLKPHVRVVKGVYSHRWEYQRGESAEEFYNKYLLDAHVITVPNRFLLYKLSDLPTPVKFFPEGVDAHLFACAPPRSGALRAGWAGNPNDPIKNFEWVKKACEGVCKLKLAQGQFNEQEMVDFYRDIDVIISASWAEGSPRPILEAMSCGRYPVSFPVGMVPELVVPGEHGTIVNKHSVDALREALEWCCENRDTVRAIGQRNADWIRSTHTWSHTIHYLKDVYTSLL
ncbi:MAG: glycosyltransferase family 4 protein [Patescibacteria group bacterium]